LFLLLFSTAHELFLIPFQNKHFKLGDEYQFFRQDDGGSLEFIGYMKTVIDTILNDPDPEARLSLRFYVDHRAPARYFMDTRGGGH
jgi:hypothetical protein